MKSFFVGVLCILWTIPSVCGAETGKVHEFRLENGMKVVVKEDHRAPVAISQVWYRVGSSDEYSGITGVSHALEHMMFKGTKRYPAGHFSAIIAEHGGNENAVTSRDYTGYFQLLEKDRLSIAFELEADRMRNLILPKEEFAKELEVIKEERRQRTDDNPNALAYEQLYATAFNNNPHHHPIIGWMEDLNMLTIEDLRSWYDAWYAPNNATLIVVGDVDPEAVSRLAERYFGDIEPRALRREKPRREPPQHGERRATIKAPAELPFVVQGYKVPVLGGDVPKWEPYALEVLAGILDGGHSARLTRQLVRNQEVAAGIGAGYSLYGRHNGLFIIEATPARGRSIQEVEQALAKEIERLKQELVTETELKRVKAQVLASEVYQRDSVSHQANLLALVETVGLGWEALDEYVENVQAVTADQVRQVVKKYFVDDRKTSVVVAPLRIRATNRLTDSAEARS